MLTTCPCCDSQNIKKLIDRTDKYSYIRCKDCGLVFSNPMPSPYEIESFYQGFLYQPLVGGTNRDRITEISHWTCQISEDIAHFWKLPEMRHVSLLDLGGGCGFFAYGFSKLGYNATLLDLDKDACDYATRTFGCFEVVNEDYFTFNPRNKFDIIFANQIIEHSREPQALLQKIHNLLNHDGLIILTTPNQQSKEFFFRLDWLLHYLRVTSTAKYPVKSLFAFLKYPWICCDPPRHLYAFNRDNLCKLLQRTGYSVVKYFTEYSDIEYYSGRMDYSIDFRIRNRWAPFRILREIYTKIGLKSMRLLDLANAYGNNLVVFATKN